VDSFKAMSAAIAGLTLVAIANSQSTYPLKSFPNDDAMTREAAKNKSSSADVFNQPELGSQRNSFPNIDVAPNRGVDIEAIAKQYRGSIPELKQEDLFVFASFSMPKASIERMMFDAAKVGAVVVFRGFKNNSWKETAETIAAFKNNGVNAVVNPNAFKAFKVNVVPVVVMTAPTALQQLDDEGCAPEKEYSSIVGDVTLDFALERIAKKSPKFATASQRYAKAIRGSL
jgi:conjugal transfer pilus assembly protein TrbC